MKHNAKQSGSEGLTTITSSAAVDAAGDVIAFSIQAAGQTAQQMAFECTPDEDGPWVECTNE